MIKTSFFFFFVLLLFKPYSLVSTTLLKVTLNISAVNQISTGLQNDVMLVTLLFRRKGNVNFTGAGALLFFFLNWHDSETTELSFPARSPVNRTHAECPGQTPALRIPRWDRHDNDAGVRLWSVRTNRKPGRRAKLV